METSLDCLAKLSEQELIDHFTALVSRDRRTTAELLVAIAEIDERKLWATHACSSMFTFCMERFHMSEQITMKRLWAARTARRFPVILEMVARGELHLGAIHLLSRHLTARNHIDVLQSARHKSCREVERLVAELAPRADVPSRIRALPVRRGASRAVDEPALAGLEEAAAIDRASTGERAEPAADGSGETVASLVNATSTDERSTRRDPNRRVDIRMPSTIDSRPTAKPIVALSPRRYKIEITVDEATHDKLRSLQDLMARSDTGRDPAAIISRAIQVLLTRTLARKAACVARPEPVKPATPTTSTTGTTSATPTEPVTPIKHALPTTSGLLSSRVKPKRPGLRRSPAPGPDATTASGTERSRRILAAVRREVWQRDSGRCCYVDSRGHRCNETSNVEFHHKAPFALGGLATTENIELRCAAHNQFQADLDFGRTFMDAKRGKGAAA
jgi:hypothetical protein